MFNFKKDKPIKNNESIFVSSLNFEDQKEYMIKKSEKRAWIITFLSVAISLFFALIILIMMPLKQVIPYVIKSNENGVPTLITAFDPEKLTYDAALDKYFVANYIINRESYTYQTIQTLFLETQIFNSSSVNKDYISSMLKKPTIDETMKQGTIKVVIKSIILDTAAGINTASIRIDKIIQHEDQEQPSIVPYIIRLSYEYKPEKILKLEYRIQNPIGFKITSYQINQEVN